MNLMDKVRAKAKANPVRVAFPEANDLKMILAMKEISDGEYGTVVVVGDIAEIQKLCKDNSVDDTKWEYVDIKNEEVSSSEIK